MEFQGQDGKQVVLRGMNTYPPNQYHHKEWRLYLDKETQNGQPNVVTFRKLSDNNTQHPADIQALLQKHEKVFKDLLAG